MGADFQPIHVMKHLIGIFMSSMYYNAQLTVNYLEMHGLTVSVVQEMIKLKKNFKHLYERKFFIIGLSEMLRAPNLPESLKPILVDLLSNIVEMIIVLNEKIQKELLQKAHKDLKDNDDDEEESESEEESDYYGKESDNDDFESDNENLDDKEIDDDCLGFVDKKDSATIEDDMEETKGEPTFTNDDKAFGSDDEDIDQLVSKIWRVFDTNLVRLGHHLRYINV